MRLLTDFLSRTVSKLSQMLFTFWTLRCLGLGATYTVHLRLNWQARIRSGLLFVLTFLPGVSC